MTFALQPSIWWKWNSSKEKVDARMLCQILFKQTGNSFEDICIRRISFKSCRYLFRMTFFIFHNSKLERDLHGRPNNFFSCSRTHPTASRIINYLKVVKINIESRLHKEMIMIQWKLRNLSFSKVRTGISASSLPTNKSSWAYELLKSGNGNVNHSPIIPLKMNSDKKKRKFP